MSGSLAYAAYCAALGATALPWEDLSEPVRTGWEAAAKAVREAYPPLDEAIAIAAVRHDIGRTTYVPEATVRYLLAHWERFASKTRSVLLRDIERELDEGRVPEHWRERWQAVVDRAKRGEGPP